MKIILVTAAVVLGLAAGSARAEGPNTFEMARTAKPIMAGQSGTDIGSASMPMFSGSARHSSTLVVTDEGSEAMPSWAPPQPVKVVHR